MTKVAVIGAGVMGLAAAYHLTKAGHRVEVFEADDRAGGMAAHFDLDGLSVERFHHFVCKADQPIFDLLAELGISDRLRWRPTLMGLYYQGALYPWDGPVALLRFPHLDLVSKLRYALHVFSASRRSDWAALDRLAADDWVRAWGGERVWRVLWEKLFGLKFFEESHNVSAAWLWTRIKRVGTSRRGLFHEEFGYIDGGSETLVRRLVEGIETKGGAIHLKTPVQQVTLAEGAVAGVTVGGAQRPFRYIISTVPLPLVPRLVPGLSAPVKARYSALKNIGVVCVVHKLSRSVTRNFWLTINDSRIAIPGLVELSNLRDFAGAHIVFTPYYMPVTHPKFALDDAALIEESFGYLKLINPALADGDRLASAVGRLHYAQPICPPRYLESVPPVVTSIRGLQIADTSSYYPEDRGIGESVRFGQIMAERIIADETKASHP
jgi:protoporphyrinogen oxidase